MEQWFRGILHKDWMKILTTGPNANRTVWWTAFDRMMEGSLVAYLAALLIGLYEYLMKSRWNSIRAFTCWILGKKQGIIRFSQPSYTIKLYWNVCVLVRWLRYAFYPGTWFLPKELTFLPQKAARFSICMHHWYFITGIV